MSLVGGGGAAIAVLGYCERGYRVQRLRCMAIRRRVQHGRERRPVPCHGRVCLPHGTLLALGSARFTAVATAAAIISPSPLPAARPALTAAAQPTAADAATVPAAPAATVAPTAFAATAVARTT